MSFEPILFFILASVALISAIVMVSRANPVQGVLFLIVNFFSLAVLYLLLRAQFIAIIQILVYAGAIMVLFLFVIMLLNLGDERGMADRFGFRKLAAFVLAGAVLVEIVAGILLSAHALPEAALGRSAAIGTVEAVGRSLFSDYVLPFEVTSVLLLAAMVGVLVLAKRKFD